MRSSKAKSPKRNPQSIDWKKFVESESIKEFECLTLKKLNETHTDFSITMQVYDIEIEFECEVTNDSYHSQVQIYRCIVIEESGEVYLLIRLLKSEF